MDEIIVIRAADPDGSLFQAIMDVLKDKRAEVIHAAASVSSVLRIGELEIHHGHRRVLMAGREVRLNHGEYAMLSCMAEIFQGAALCSGLGRGVSAWDYIGREYHLAAETEIGI